MTKNFTLFIIVILHSVALLGCTGQNLNQPAEPTPSLENDTPTLPTTPIKMTAKFEIYTNGTKRIFTDTKYHRQSPNVYIERADPSIVLVNQPGVTWDDFFKTLPFSMTKDCLITGTKQTFCSNESQTLGFFLNELETPNALDLPIQDNDVLKVNY